MASALALGNNGLRLRSRRLRSSKSHALVWWLAIALAGMLVAGFATARELADLSLHATPVADAATLQQTQFAAEVRPVRIELQQSVARLGLVVAAYESGQIDRAELQRRLSAVLASYEDLAGQLDTLDVPTSFRPTIQQYMETLSSLNQAGLELSRAYDDGDQAQVARALAMSLQVTAQLHELAPAPN